MDIKEICSITCNAFNLSYVAATSKLCRSNLTYSINSKDVEVCKIYRSINVEDRSKSL